ncbi:HlyD family efflux transporter periplasmic adaptor subunit [Rhodopirellula baltica]|nr:HlyD family secretion protein [Rhodopirellula baltica]
MSVNKWQRILVSASGIYVELLIGAIAMFVWSHTFPGTLHSIALNAAAISTVSTVIFNANPLIKFDGYYIFSDLIEVPNLQETSSRCLSRSAAWCLGFSLEKDVFSPKSGRHWFASYAVLSFIYRWFILAVILWTIHQVVLPYRVESATGIWATVVMAMMSWQLFRQGKSVVESRKPGQHNFRRLVISSVVVSLALVVLFFVPLRLHHRASVYVELQEPITIYTSTGGTVVSVQSKAGEMVRENDTILVLENPEIEDKLRLLVEQRDLTSSAIRTFESVGNHSKLAIMQKELLSLERRIREIKPLIDALSLRAPHSGVVYDGQFEPPAVHSVQKTLNWSGWLLDSRNEGAFLPAGTLVAKVSSTRQCEAILYVDQDVLEDIAIDQMVTIRLDAFPDIDLQGTVVDISASGVDEIAPIASQQFGGRLPTVAKRDGSQGSEVKLFQIAVAIDTTVPITPGMRGRAKLLLNERSMAAWGYRLLRNTFYFRF